MPRDKIAKGSYLGNGHPPYGSRVEGFRHDTRLVVDEEQAAIVRQIFQLFAYGDKTGKLPAHEIARRLTALGYPTPADLKKGFEKLKKRAYEEWDAQCLYPILRNSVYVGRFKNGRFFKKDGKRHSHHIGTTTVAVPAIIDEDTWNAVQKRLDDGQAQSPRRTVHQYKV